MGCSPASLLQVVVLNGLLIMLLTASVPRGGLKDMLSDMLTDILNDMLNDMMNDPLQVA